MAQLIKRLKIGNHVKNWINKKIKQFSQYVDSHPEYFLNKNTYKIYLLMEDIKNEKRKNCKGKK